MLGCDMARWLKAAESSREAYDVLHYLKKKFSEHIDKNVYWAKQSMEIVWTFGQLNVP